MPRYIDAEKLKDDLAVLFERNEKLIDEWLANCVDDVIDEQPTVGDITLRNIGEWDMFNLISSVYFGKQMYFREESGVVYSRHTGRYITMHDALSEFLGLIGEW